MNKFKSTSKFLSCFLAIILVVSTLIIQSNVCAITKDQQHQIDNINNQIGDLDTKIKESQNKLKELEEQKKQTSKDLPELLKETDYLNDIIEGYEKKIDLLKKSINDLNSKIEITETQISLEQEDIKEIKDKLGERLRAMYIAGETSSIELLMSSDNFEEFLTRIELVHSVSKHDKGLIDDLQEKVNELKDKEKELRNNKIKVQANKDDLVESKNKLLPQKRLLDYKVIKINTKMAELEKQNKLQKSITNKLENQKFAFERQVDAILAGKTSTGSGSGRLIWPVPAPGSYISSGYYPEENPRPFTGRPHKAIDITAPGAGHELGPFTKKIIAAASGKVVYIGNDPDGYGKYIRIDHGDGLLTVYAHLFRIDVSLGKYVNQGQCVGIMGNTGYSFGAHLHFEVRVNGKKQNPNHYVSIP